MDVVTFDERNFVFFILKSQKKILCILLVVLKLIKNLIKNNILYNLLSIYFE